VIAANASALPEAVGEAGMLVDPRDADGWTAALRELLDDRELNARYRARALQRWAPLLPQRTTEGFLAALERTVDDGA
jgi:glycosyltransferase involved in cell wall biosynthesis